ncbi:MAG TPA: class I SAM-dependent methyltransferase [Blastocatellia bacterium]|nr:class I SAM-dependent methyltransferase [Blastocatellia bacterium]
MFLSEETPLAVEDSAGSKRLTPADDAGSVGWRTMRTNIIARLGLAVKANARVVFEPLKVSAGDTGFITFGPTEREAVADRVEVSVRFRPTDDPGSAENATREVELLRQSVPGFDPQQPWIEQPFELDEVVGRVGAFVVECVPTSTLPSEADELGFYEFVVSDEKSIDLNRARAFKALRMRNEEANFDAYYQNAIFQCADPPPPADPEAGPTAAVEPEPDPVITAVAVGGGSVAAADPQPPPPEPKGLLRNMWARWHRRFTAAETTPENSPAIARVEEAPAPQTPAAPTSAFAYSHELLIKLLQLNPPPFGWRLQTKLSEFEAAGKGNGSSKFRVLSLCAGAARIETDFVRSVASDNLHVTLVDINPKLLEMARQRIAKYCDVEVVIEDVNELDLQGEKFDLILCVSGLHHVVELERLIGAIAHGLSGGGEFWAIGETIGRNGGKLWPESYEVANAFFSKLDKKYRVNRMTGLNVEDNLLDTDCSIGCFEGIRCEAIEPTLLNFLSPIHVSKHNCIVWKLFSPTYSENYDMQNPVDVALVEEAVHLDVDLFRRGGRAIELNGVYGLR